MSEKEEEQFQSNNICWICEKLTDDEDEKVRDHCHLTSKLRGAAHWSCNYNSNLRGYDSHLIFDVKIDVIPCHYLSSSGLSWHAMLKMTGVRLEKIVDIDMYLFIEKVLREEEFLTVLRDMLKQITNT